MLALARRFRPPSSAGSSRREFGELPRRVGVEPPRRQPAQFLRTARAIPRSNSRRRRIGDSGGGRSCGVDFDAVQHLR